MKALTVYKTNDGTVHKDFAAARRHLALTYSDCITALAHKLVHKEKYAEICEFIDENLHQFVNLHNIKAEMQITEEELHEYADVEEFE